MKLFKNTNMRHHTVLIVMAVLLSGCLASAQQRQRDDDNETKKTNHAADVYTELAMGYMEKGNFQVALEKIDEALKANPKSPEANTVAAVINEQIGRVDLAGKLYLTAVQLDPSDGRMQNNYGQFLCNHDQPKESIKHFQLAVEDPFYPTPAVAYTNMGACLEKLKDYQSAETSYRAALEIDESFPDLLFRLSRIMCNQKKFFSGRAFLQRYHSVAATTPSTLYLCYQIETGMLAQATAEQCKSELLDKYPESEIAKKLSGNQNNGQLCQ